LYYPYIENGVPKSYSYGTLYIGPGFEQLTILIYEIQEVSPNETRRHWNSETGFVLSAPAQNRDEALQITTDLMATPAGITLAALEASDE
jgi:hypothetical protein